MVQQFHKALALHYNKEGHGLFDPKEMEALCDVYAPGLFDEIYLSIFNESKHIPSEKRKTLQKVRVVAILHSLSFFRNHVINNK